MCFSRPLQRSAPLRGYDEDIICGVSLFIPLSEEDRTYVLVAIVFEFAVVLQVVKKAGSLPVIRHRPEVLTSLNHLSVGSPGETCAVSLRRLASARSVIP